MASMKTWDESVKCCLMVDAIRLECMPGDCRAFEQIIEITDSMAVHASPTPSSDAICA